MAELNQHGLYIDANILIEKLYSIELPIPPMVAAMARQRGYKPKPEIMQIFKKVEIAQKSKLLVPRQSICNPEINKLIKDIKIDKSSLEQSKDLSKDREFCIEPMGNQEVIINYLFEKKFTEKRINNMIGTALLQLGTGYGKTYVAATVIHRIGKKTLWVLPNTSILEQTLEVLNGAFPDLNIGTWYSQAHDDPAEYDIILAIIDSLLIIHDKNEAIAVKSVIVPNKKRPKKENITYNYKQWLSFFGLTVYDEVHKYATPVYSEVFWNFSAPIVFAMSATVNENRNNLDAIYKFHFGDEIISENIPGFQKDELQWKGTVSVIKYQNPPEYSKILINPLTNALSFSNLITQFATDPERNKLIINCLAEALKDKHNVFVFCEYRDHCEKLAKLFKETNTALKTLEYKDEIIIVNPAETGNNDNTSGNKNNDKIPGLIGSLGRAQRSDVNLNQRFKFDDTVEHPDEAKNEHSQDVRGSNNPGLRPVESSGDFRNENPQMIRGSNKAVLLRGGASTEDVDTARKNASVIFTTYAYTNVGVSIPRMSCIIFATPRKSNMIQIIGRIERRGGDIEKARKIYDIIDDLTPLRKQFNTRKVVYKIKNYEISFE